MGTQTFANGSVVYTSDEDQKTCIDNLKDDAHYRFSCRCGCGGQFAGFGRDLKASAKIGRAPVVGVGGDAEHENAVAIRDPIRAAIKADIYNAYNDHTHEISSPREVIPVAPMTPVSMTQKILEEVVDVSETGGAPRAQLFVSDRYLKKAQFDLSDDEIDAYQEGKDDPLAEQGVELSRRQPPGIADLVYSLSTGEGPYSLLEYQQREVRIEGGGQTRVLCGLCRTAAGRYKTIPLADLAIHYAGRPVVKKARKWILPVVVVLTSSAVSAAVSLAYLFLH